MKCSRIVKGESKLLGGDESVETMSKMKWELQYEMVIELIRDFTGQREDFVY